MPAPALVEDFPPRVLRTALAFAISLFFIWGLAYGLLDVLNKHFQNVLHVGTAQSTWLQIAYFGAYLLVSLPAGALLQARGYRFGILTGLMVTAAGALLFVPAAAIGTFPFFVGSMFVLAAGLCCLETAADSYVNVLGPPQDASRRLNLAQSFNGLGTFIGPLIGGTWFFGGEGSGGGLGTVQVIYALIGAAILVFALFVRRAHLPEIAEPAHPGDGIEGRSIFAHRHFTLGVLTQAIYIGAQVGCGALFINVALATWGGLGARAAAYLLSLALLVYMVGRFVSTALLARVRAGTLLAVFGCANVLLSLLVAADIDHVSLVAMIGVFFFMSTMFPTIFTLGVRELGPQTKQGASFMVMAIGGGVVLPYPMGLLAEAYGPPAAYLMPAVCFLLVALYGWRGSAVRGASAPRPAR